MAGRVAAARVDHGGGGAGHVVAERAAAALSAPRAVGSALARRNGQRGLQFHRGPAPGGARAPAQRVSLVARGGQHRPGSVVLCRGRQLPPGPATERHRQRHAGRHGSGDGDGGVHLFCALYVCRVDRSVGGAHRREGPVDGTQPGRGVAVAPSGAGDGRGRGDAAARRAAGADLSPGDHHACARVVLTPVGVAGHGERLADLRAGLAAGAVDERGRAFSAMGHVPGGADGDAPAGAGLWRHRDRAPHRHHHAVGPP